MTFKHITAALLSFSLALPVSAAPIMPRPFVSAEGKGDIVAVASKGNKKKRHVRRNPKNGDVLLGRVGPSGQRKASRSQRRHNRDDAALGALLGAALVGAVVGGVSPGRGGGIPSRSRGHAGSGGGNAGGDIAPMGNNCGVQYWTAHPTSPTC